MGMIQDSKVQKEKWYKEIIFMKGTSDGDSDLQDRLSEQEFS